MKLTLTSTFITVIILTLITALVATSVASALLVPVIVGLSLIKFWLVVFQFMEMKKANVFWKVLIIGFGVLIGLILVLLL